MIFQLLKSILVLAGTITGVAIGYATVSNYPDVVKEAVDMENPQLVLSALFGFIGYLFCSMIGCFLFERYSLNENYGNVGSRVRGTFWVHC